MDEKRRWIKLYMMDYDEVYHDSKMLHLWIDILLHANPVDYYHHGQLIKRGQCILSLRQVSERCGMAKNTITKYLHLLEECGKIKLDISRKGTLITVENWDKYQNRVSPSVLKVGQEVGQEVGRNKNKRIKEIKNKRRLSVSDSDLSDLKSFLIENDFEEVSDEVIETCKLYGLEKITNLKNFALAVAKEKKWYQKKKKLKKRVTEEDKEELRRLTEELGGDL
jgi:DNA-binding transcriptional regulator YhcF (GntR family)